MTMDREDVWRRSGGGVLMFLVSSPERSRLFAEKNIYILISSPTIILSNPDFLDEETLDCSCLELEVIKNSREQKDRRLSPSANASPENIIIKEPGSLIYLVQMCWVPI